MQSKRAPGRLVTGSHGGPLYCFAMPARLAVAPILAVLAVCSCGRGHDVPPPPQTEFLLLAGDSTFWVHYEASRLRVRGSPIQIALVDDRLVEIYVADDDRSFQGALLVGQRIYRRDLLTGDSALVFDDTTITSLARWYGREHPRERPLRPDESTDAEPRMDVMGEVATLDQHGPFLSFEYRVDGVLDGANEMHEVRRGVVDLRDGSVATLTELFGDSAARAITAEGALRFSRALDSVITSTDDRARVAIPMLADLEFDQESFTLVAVRREPAVEFTAIGSGPVAGGIVLSMEPIQAPAREWWGAVRDALPVSSGKSTDRWTKGAIAVEARYDSAGHRADLFVAQPSVGRFWRLASIPAPASRLFWLESAADSASRQALTRAFDEAALYSDDARTAVRPMLPRRGATFVMQGPDDDR